MHVGPDGCACAHLHPVSRARLLRRPAHHRRASCRQDNVRAAMRLVPDGSTTQRASHRTPCMLGVAATLAHTRDDGERAPLWREPAHHHCVLSSGERACRHAHGVGRQRHATRIASDAMHVGPDGCARATRDDGERAPLWRGPAHPYRVLSAACMNAFASVSSIFPTQRIRLPTQWTTRLCAAPRVSRSCASRSRRSGGAPCRRNACVRANNCNGGVHGCVCIHEHHLGDPTRWSPDATCKPPMRRTSRRPLPHVAITQKRRHVVPAQRVRASTQLQRRHAWMRARPCGPSGKPNASVSRCHV